MKHIIEMEDTQQCLQELNELTKRIDEINAKSEKAIESIKFLKVSDVAELMGITITSARQIFHRPDFPSCDYGKEMMVEIGAFIDYFKKPVKKGDF